MSSNQQEEKRSSSSWGEDTVSIKGNKCHKTILEAGRFPSFAECEARDWHRRASDADAREKVLFVSHSWSPPAGGGGGGGPGGGGGAAAAAAATDPCGRKYAILRAFLEGQPAGRAAQWVYLDCACAAPADCADGDGMRRLNVLTALWRATDFIIIPKIIEIPCLFKAGAALPATDLREYVGRPARLLEALAALLAPATRVFCAFQIGRSTAFREFDRPEGGSSSLGFHQAYLDVWDRFMAQSRQDMLEADRIALRAAWKVAEPCRLLGLVVGLARGAAHGASGGGSGGGGGGGPAAAGAAAVADPAGLLRAASRLGLGRADVERDPEGLGQIFERLGPGAVEEDRLAALNLLLFVALCSLNVLSLGAPSPPPTLWAGGTGGGGGEGGDQEEEEEDGDEGWVGGEQQRQQQQQQTSCLA